MKYAEICEFNLQCEPAVSRVNKVRSFVEKRKPGLKNPFRPRFDPTRLTEAERCEAGIMECEVDWYKAWNAPLVKW